MAQTKWYNNTPDDVAHWYFGYSDRLKAGNADLSQYQKYLNVTNQYGLKKHAADDNTLRNLSIKALSGDKYAQDYFNATKTTALRGADMWKGFDPTKGFNSNQALKTYLNDMAGTQWAKKYDNDAYNKYNDAITNNKPMEDWEVELYQDIVSRRNLEDYNNPYNQAIAQLGKDKQGALAAQDTALNQGMAQMDANSFQQLQQLQQTMAHRGMADSGISADAYMRAQMGNNQNYQQAFAQSAMNKSQLETQYNEAINNAKLGKFDYDMKLQQAQQEQAIKLQELQNEQDKWLTQATGSVFINGQRLMVDGKPLTTVEWEKLSEEKRHNLATEALTGQKNAWDYELGMDSNSIKRQQIAVDLQIATSKLQLDYAKLDYNYSKLESDNAIAQDKIRIAAENAQTGADKAKITALGQQLNSLTKQITEYQKAGKKPPKALVDQYNDVTGQLQALAGNF